jgi:Zn-finger nucleic acid-binding protein
MFLEEPVLAEMIREMLPPPPRAVGALALSVAKRTGEALACPQCGDAMKPTTIHEVELDHCTKHGVWFDQEELRITLYRAGLPDNAPPFRELEGTPQLPRKPFAKRAEKIEPNAPRLVFVIEGEQIETQVSVVKIGTLQSSTLRFADDPDVAHLHAVIEVDWKAVKLIDLGSKAGTYVNGKRVKTVKLDAGDLMRFGNTYVSILI